MESVYGRGAATAAEVRSDLADAPGYSSVRKQLELLVGKGLLRHTLEGRSYVYHPVVSQRAASRTVLTRLVDGFFRGDHRAAMVALLGIADRPPTDVELRTMLAEARAHRDPESR